MLGVATDASLDGWKKIYLSEKTELTLETAADSGLGGRNARFQVVEKVFDSLRCKTAKARLASIPSFSLRPALLHSVETRASDDHSKIV